MVRGAELKKRTDRMAFRAQLMLPEQRQLFDYWYDRLSDASLPLRCDINPVHFPRLLPGISLIDIAEDMPQSRVRLAGTRLRDIYDREITGLQINEIGWGERHDYWMTAYEHTVDNCVPTQGILRGPVVHKEHLVQYWLKLPLTRKGGTTVDMVLCLDSFVPAPVEVVEEKAVLFA
jgi:hypothetical protein